MDLDKPVAVLRRTEPASTKESTQLDPVKNVSPEDTRPIKRRRYDADASLDPQDGPKLDICALVRRKLVFNKRPEPMTGILG